MPQPPQIDRWLAYHREFRAVYDALAWHDFQLKGDLQPDTRQQFLVGRDSFKAVAAEMVANMQAGTIPDAWQPSDLTNVKYAVSSKPEATNANQPVR